jgi:hypothetical protein
MMEMPNLGELLKLAAEFFGNSRWWPIIESAAAIAIIAGFIRITVLALPGLPAFVTSVARAAGRIGSRSAAFLHRSLRDALTTKHAQEPRWVKPTWLLLELFFGAYFALLFSLYFVQFVLFAALGQPGAEPWKRFAAGGAALVMLVAGKVFTTQARDAWHQIRQKWNDRRKGGPKLLPARAGTFNNDGR